METVRINKQVTSRRTTLTGITGKKQVPEGKINVVLGFDDALVKKSFMMIPCMGRLNVDAIMGREYMKDHAVLNMTNNQFIMYPNNGEDFTYNMSSGKLVACINPSKKCIIKVKCPSSPKEYLEFVDTGSKLSLIKSDLVGEGTVEKSRYVLTRLAGDKHPNVGEVDMKIKIMKSEYEVSFQVVHNIGSVDAVISCVVEQ